MTPYPEFRDLRTGATSELAAEAFGRVWGVRLEWVRRPSRFMLGHTLFRVRQRGLGWEVIEDKPRGETNGKLAYRLAARVCAHPQ